MPRLKDAYSKLEGGDVALIDKYLHVENGGYSFKAIAHLGERYYTTTGLEITSTFMHTSTVLHLSEMSAEDLEELGKELILAAKRLRQLNTPKNK